MVGGGCQPCEERQAALLTWVNGAGKWILLAGLALIILAVTGTPTRP